MVEGFSEVEVLMFFISNSVLLFVEYYKTPTEFQKKN